MQICCYHCGSDRCRKSGFYWSGDEKRQRFKCKECGKYFKADFRGSQVLIEDILTLLNRGMSYAAIARELKVTRQAIADRMKRHKQKEKLSPLDNQEGDC